MHDDEVVAALPSEPHDQPVDLAVTTAGRVIRFDGARFDGARFDGAG